MKETEFFRELNRKPKYTILDSILISDVTYDNIIVSINNRFVKIFKFIDINFVLQEMNRKRENPGHELMIIRIQDPFLNLKYKRF